MNLDLSGKVALVAGSTQGIGKEAAIELSKMGAAVILVARNESSLKSALQELDRGLGQEHRYLVADFTKPEQVRAKIEALVKEGVQVNIVVNNSGGPKGGKAMEAETTDFEAAFAQHLICNHIITTALIPGMKARKYGRIINVISTSVKAPLKDLGVSNTVRGAVANWAKTLANEVGAFGITVNNVLPGATNTARLKEIIQRKAEQTGQSIESVEAGMAGAVPLGRIADPKEVANAIAFLASPAASYINGINLPVDGGRTASL